MKILILMISALMFFGCMGKPSLDFNWLQSANMGDINKLKIILEKNKDKENFVNIRNKEGYTALMVAASSNQVETIIFLLQNRAEIDAKNNYGVTALMRAAKNGHYNAVMTLVERRADFNAIDNEGFSVMSYARSGRYNKKVVEYLQEKGASY